VLSTAAVSDRSASKRRRPLKNCIVTHGIRAAHEILAERIRSRAPTRHSPQPVVLDPWIRNHHAKTLWQL
jgi:hypothetical protein